MPKKKHINLLFFCFCHVITNENNARISPNRTHIDITDCEQWMNYRIYVRWYGSKCHNSGHCYARPHEMKWKQSTHSICSILVSYCTMHRGHAAIGWGGDRATERVRQGQRRRERMRDIVAVYISAIQKGNIDPERVVMQPTAFITESRQHNPCAQKFIRLIENNNNNK